MSVKTALLTEAIGQAESLERKNEQLQQRVFELQRENRDLRSRLDAIHGASVSECLGTQDQRADPRTPGQREAMRASNTANGQPQQAQGIPHQFPASFGAGIG